MKVSEKWLRTWADPALDSRALADQLTMAGLEVESITPVASPFSDVVIAEVTDVQKHPEADRLKVCQVNIGQQDLLTIVCGANNVRPGIKVPLALVGAKLPGGLKISRSKIRNVVSNGMLCSPNELGLPIETDGLYELPLDAPLGAPLWDYFDFSDQVLDVYITPNRGDCLSVKGLSEEIAAVTKAPKIVPCSMHPVPAMLSDVLPITVEVPNECPHYVGRIMRRVKADAITPIWMQERLRRSGIRSITAIVDVMNYVMLELGQPMHAFDLQEIVGGIRVRYALVGETLTLLDGQDITLTGTELVIADDKKPLALAGVMGGLDSGVTLSTQDIFLESALFIPSTVAKTARQYGLGSESSYRFERGVAPDLQTAAIERATELLLSIVGGEAGPLVDVHFDLYLSKSTQIELRPARIFKLLSINPNDDEVGSILARLGFEYEKTPLAFRVTVPARRLDITTEIDLIEEVARLYGYDRLPTHEMMAPLNIVAPSTDQHNLSAFRKVLRDLGYHEAITYSFIDKKLQKEFDPDKKPKALLNPISAEMAVMRTNLWPGLINAFLYNVNRQRPRVRLFETGLRFVPNVAGTSSDDYLQQMVLSGLASGTFVPEQWGQTSRDVDFFDIKNDIQNILSLMGGRVDMKPAAHAALHPGQTADIFRDNDHIGTMGLLHPALQQKLDVRGPLFLFEIELGPLLKIRPQAKATDISKFPEIRRDIAIFIDQAVPLQAIQDTIMDVGGLLLKQTYVFDVYQDQSKPGRKSIALALILQHASRTLVDAEVAEVVERVIIALKQRFAAELRG